MSEKNLRFVFNLMSFWSGFLVMAIEMAGGRILSIWFGNSLFTWSALIGVILVAMSAGSFLGGRWVDHNPRKRILGYAFLVIGIFTTAVPWLKEVFSESLEKSGVIWGPIWGCFVLFVVPTFFLGMIPPILLRLLTHSLETIRVHGSAEMEGEEGAQKAGGKRKGKEKNKEYHTEVLGLGKAAGLLSMWGTLGSVAGTFCSSFLLIPHFSLTVIYMTAGMLALLSALIFLWPLKIHRSAVAAVMIIVAFNGFLDWKLQKVEDTSTLLFKKQTFYHLIRVNEYDLNNGRGEKYRQLSLDTSVEGAQLVNDSHKVPITYQKYWELIKFYHQQPRKALFLGGGAFAMPLSFCHDYPLAQVGVLEIDPEVIEVGKKFFRVNEGQCVWTWAGDARLGMRLENRPEVKELDFVFGDTYNSLRWIPSHLVTQEFFQLVRGNLNNQGIFMINVISALKGTKGIFFQSFVKTLKKVFPTIHIYLPRQENLSEVQNIVLVATKTPFVQDPRSWPLNEKLRIQSPELFEMVQHYVPEENWHEENPEALVFTDDHNASEFLLAKSLL